MKDNFTNPKVARPLEKSITTACFIFIMVLCLVIGLVSHLNYRRSLYQRYEFYCIDLLNYVDRHIDDEDLKNCIESLERSKKYDELESFMDGIKETFNIHYLYIIKPLNRNRTGNVMSVVSAESYYDRYIDTEGNLYLGWISNDEFGIDNVKKYFNIMDQRVPVFFEEKTEWGVDYTGALTLLDSENKPYALLCVDVDITALRHLILDNFLQNVVFIVLLGLLFTGLFLFWTRRNIIRPIKMLEQSAVNFAKNSHDQRDISALKFDLPYIKNKSEIYNLSKAVSQMTDDIKDYVSGIIQAEKEAEKMRERAHQMSEIANKDSLTGVRSKSAYDSEIKRMEYELETGNQSAFGIAMIDLNFLKKINDNFGHDKGNIALKRVCEIVCSTFEHSPVYRIGGDEFVVILKGRDFKNYLILKEEFNEKLDKLEENELLEPWEKVSAAIGIAIYDKSIDSNVMNVFKRADQIMYECKKKMKALRNS